MLWVLLYYPWLLQCSPGDDAGKVLGLERGSADEAAVNIRLGQELIAVLIVHAAAVKDADSPCGARIIHAADYGTDLAADRLGLLGGGGTAGAYGPDGFVGDDALLYQLDVYPASAALTW